MTVFRKLRLNAVFLGISALLMGSGAAAFDPITIVDQQSFAAGGKVETAPGTFEPENRGIYTQSDSPKKSSRNIWSLAVVSVDQRY